VIEGPSTEGMTIIYDGACPFCSRYVTLVRLRKQVHPIRIVDARTDDEIVGQFRKIGIDLNREMVVAWSEKYYSGADAMQLIHRLSESPSILGRALFSYKTIALSAYKMFVLGRLMTLRALGRKPLR
jgi:predicted DCC family thiol-disulfide oxidoreductase YuxK